jgi:glycerate dehydrogenase
MHRIVFLERNTIQAEFRRPNFPHEWIEHGETSPDQVRERLENASIVISNKLGLHTPDLSQLPELRLIAIAATGPDCVDLEYCGRTASQCNVRGYAGIQSRNMC